VDVLDGGDALLDRRHREAALDEVGKIEGERLLRSRERIAAVAGTAVCSTAGVVSELGAGLNEVPPARGVGAASVRCLLLGKKLARPVDEVLLALGQFD
jgi:hypothetical protein